MGRSAIILILDGCSVKALKRARTPCLKELFKRGSYNFKCRSIFPTLTYSAHASIMTGARPDAHGIVGNTFYDRSSGAILDFDREDVNRYLLSETIFERVEGFKVSVGEPVTKGADIAITKEEVQARDVEDQDRYAIEAGIKLLRKYEPTLAVINLPGIDRIGELYGPLSSELLRHLEEVDALTLELKSVLDEIYEDYLLVALADHGMTSVRENLDLSEILRGLNVTICISHRMAHVYVEGGGLKGVTERLKMQGKFKLLRPDECRLESLRSGDLLIVAKEGYELGDEPLKGSHGGLSRDEMYVPLIVNKPEYEDLLRDADITVVKEIVLRYLREALAIDFVKEKLKLTDPAHGWEHTARVLETASRLAVKYRADVEAVRLSCLFHDTERGRCPEGHELRSASTAAMFLSERACSKELVDKVRRIVLKHHSDPKKLETVEEKILWDADKLDSLGIVGLSRCLLEAGFYRQSVRSAIEHFLRDLKEFGDQMHFKETKRIAKARTINALRFLEKLKAELESDRRIKSRSPYHKLFK
jgi:uncharacterized protein